MKRYKKVVFFTTLTIAFIGTSIPGKHIPKITTSLNDKIWHILIYLILGILYPYRKISIKRDLLCFSPLFFYTVFDELHQIFIPNRNCSIIDLLADFLGLIIAFSLTKIYLYLYELKKIKN